MKTDNDASVKVFKIYRATACLLEGPKRFGELEGRSPVSVATLSKYLDDGESMGIIKKDPVMPPEGKAYFHYVLTDIGQCVYGVTEKFDMKLQKIMSSNS